MENTQFELEGFFTDYASRMNKALANPPIEDVDGTQKAFAEYFIEANPKGVIGGQNDASFAEAIPKGWAFYRSIGTKAMQIEDISFTTLDDFHAQANVRWKAFYRKEDGSADIIEFDVIYFVQLREGLPQIFAYITGDEEQVYKDHGLVAT